MSEGLPNIAPIKKLATIAGIKVSIGEDAARDYYLLFQTKDKAAVDFLRTQIMERLNIAESYTVPEATKAEGRDTVVAVSQVAPYQLAETDGFQFCINPDSKTTAEGYPGSQPKKVTKKDITRTINTLATKYPNQDSLSTAIRVSNKASQTPIR